eukprot:275858_1
MEPNDRIRCPGMPDWEQIIKEQNAAGANGANDGHNNNETAEDKKKREAAEHKCTGCTTQTTTQSNNQTSKTSHISYYNPVTNSNRSHKRRRKRRKRVNIPHKRRKQGKRRYITINNIDPLMWEKHIHPQLHEERKQIQIKRAYLIHKKHHNNTNNATAIICTTNIYATKAFIASMRHLGFINKTSTIQNSNKHHTNKLISKDSKANTKAVIKGMQTITDCVAVEKKISEIANRNTKNVFRYKTLSSWIIEITFHSARLCEKFINQWILNKKEEPIFNRFMAYHSNISGNKMRHHRITNNAIHLVHNKILYHIQKNHLIPSNIRKEITSALTNTVPNTLTIHDTNIQTHNLDFMHIYDVFERKQGTETTATNDTNTYDTNLSALYYNIGGNAEKRIKTGSPLREHITIHKPILIAFGEIKDSKSDITTAKQKYKIEGYTIVAYQPAFYTDKQEEIRERNNANKALGCPTSASNAWTSSRMKQPNPHYE